MPITPLPQFEADLKEYLDERDREAYEALKPPDTVVLRYGRMKMVGEFPYKGESKPGCGSRLIARTPRGTELGEMLTSTCPNAGCGKSVTRKDMLEYIENSGGRNYPFSTKGAILRIATGDDLSRHAQHEQMAHAWKMDARARAERLGVTMRIVDAEMILGREVLTFFYSSETRVDFRELVHELAAEHATRIEMRQVGARDEARATADYERCGQYCCCKNFLKVLKPVSMRSAKEQKATLDPLKISGRCGRLMCCLRYEDQTYADLRKRLPHRNTEVGTPEGDGVVVDTQILTQLVLVRLADDRRVAIPVEEITPPDAQPEGEKQTSAGEQPTQPARRKRRRRRSRTTDASAPQSDQKAPPADKDGPTGQDPKDENKPPRKRRRRRSRKRRPPQE